MGSRDGGDRRRELRRSRSRRRDWRGIQKFLSERFGRLQGLPTTFTPGNSGRREGRRDAGRGGSTTNLWSQASASSESEEPWMKKIGRTSTEFKGLLMGELRTRKGREGARDRDREARYRERTTSSNDESCKRCRCGGPAPACHYVSDSNDSSLFSRGPGREVTALPKCLPKQLAAVCPKKRTPIIILTSNGWQGVDKSKPSATRGETFCDE